MEQVPPVLQGWYAAGRELDLAGQRIFARSGGDPGGAVLLLIHGFPTASWDWSEVWAPLARHWRLLACDMLGFGFSAKPAAHRYTIGEQADICEALLSAEGVREYHVLAHDYGDTVAQELLARALETGERPQLRSVCLLNGGVFPEAHSPLLLQRLLRSPLGPVLARVTSRRLFDATMHHIFGRGTPPSPATLDAFWQLLTRSNGLRVIPRVIQYMAERRTFRSRWVGALEQARVPLKLIVGTADPIAGMQVAVRYRELVPRADVTELAGIGHYPQLEAAMAVVDAYVAFRRHVPRMADAGSPR